MNFRKICLAKQQLYGVLSWKRKKKKTQNRQGKSTLRTHRSKISGIRCHSGRLSIWFLRNLFRLACSLFFLRSKVKNLMYAMKKFLPPREIQFKIDIFLTLEGEKGRLY